MELDVSANFVLMVTIIGLIALGITYFLVVKSDGSVLLSLSSIIFQHSFLEIQTFKELRSI